MDRLPFHDEVAVDHEASGGREVLVVVDTAPMFLTIWTEPGRWVHSA